MVEPLWETGSRPTEDVSHKHLVRMEGSCAVRHDHCFGHRYGYWAYPLENLSLNIASCGWREKTTLISLDLFFGFCFQS